MSIFPFFFWIRRSNRTNDGFIQSVSTKIYYLFVHSKIYFIKWNESFWFRDNRMTSYCHNGFIYTIYGGACITVVFLCCCCKIHKKWCFLFKISRLIFDHIEILQIIPARVKMLYFVDSPKKLNLKNELQTCIFS